jgi:hypothetical protein
MFGFNNFLQKISRLKVGGLLGRRTLVGARSILAVALVFEQVAWLIPSQLRKGDQLALIERVAPAPSDCRVSFLADVSHINASPWYALQTDMMLISALRKVPTANGYSGLSPFGWSMDDPRAPNYLTKVALWLAVHDLEAQACGLDLGTGQWESNIPARLSDALSYRLGEVIDFRTGGNSSSYMAYGWQDSEPNGTWTNGRQAVLVLNPGNSIDRRQLVLLAKVYPLVTSGSPDVRIRILLNGISIAQRTLTTATDLAIPIRANLLKLDTFLRLDFFIEDPKTPAELGIGTDTRKLGIMVVNLAFKPVE